MTKIGRPEPKWLRQLPSGNYTNREIATLTGKNMRTVQSIMAKYCKDTKSRKTMKGHETIFFWINPWL